jgi:hypothetical protein
MNRALARPLKRNAPGPRRAMAAAVATREGASPRSAAHPSTCAAPHLRIIVLSLLTIKIDSRIVKYSDYQ